MAITEYTEKRIAQINANYHDEREKARRIPFGCGLSDIYDNELVESDFTEKELDDLDKMIRETLDEDFEVLAVIAEGLTMYNCSQCFIDYAIIHKELFARANASFDHRYKEFHSENFNRIVIRNSAGDYLSTGGYIWLNFNKHSNNDTILYRSDDVETFGIKPKYKKTWRKDGHTYRCSEILFDKFLENCKEGIEKVKERFKQFI